MYLHEYQGKNIFKKHGLYVPNGFVCTNLKDALKNSINFSNSSWIIKCQVHSGSRSFSNAVKKVFSINEIISFVNFWFNRKLVTKQTSNFGLVVKYILVEELINFTKEIYLGITIDRNINRVVFFISRKGGINIEKNIFKKSTFISKVIIDPLIGPQVYQSRFLGFSIGLNINQVQNFSLIFMKLLFIFFKYDLIFLEINPLVITTKDNFICLDVKIDVDDNSLFRQNKLKNIEDISQKNKNEIFAKRLGFNYIKMNGKIGCMVNGAGLAMSIIDMIKLHGGSSANFLDFGGKINEDCVFYACKILFFEKSIKGILVNIFGGIVHCTVIAKGIIKFFKSFSNSIPVVLRFDGTFANDGIKLLLQFGINIFYANSLVDAIKKIVYLTER